MSFYAQHQSHDRHHHQHQQQQTHHTQQIGSDSDLEHDSSDAATPPGAASGASSSFLSSSVSSLWGGLLRRFSSDAAGSSSWSSALHAPPHAPPYSYSFDSTNNGIDGVFVPPHIHRTSSPLHLPPLEPLTLAGFREDTSTEARLLTPTVAEEIRIMVPARLSIVDEWNLVYSLDQDGASLTTLYEKCRRYEGRRVGFVLVVKDSDGAIFGAYLSDFPHPAPKYFGTGECFLWRASVMASLPPPPSADTTHLSGRTTTIANMSPYLGPPDSGGHSGTGSANSLSIPPSPSIRFKAFPYSGVNEYYMLCEAHFLSVGAGDGKFGLWLDDGLAKGVSSTCLTFGNEKLSDEGEKFRILGVEVWVIGASEPV